jgi:hypothetical protein
MFKVNCLWRKLGFNQLSIRVTCETDGNKMCNDTVGYPHKQH